VNNTRKQSLGPENMEENGPKSAARLVTIDQDEADRRLDNFLLSRLKGVPRSRIYKMIRSGEVRVNKGRAKPDRRLCDGDRVRIPPVRTRAAVATTRRGSDSVRWLEDRIIYEDRDLLVLDKPSGLAVHGGSGIDFGAIEMLRMLRPERDKLELVHRLDRDTSGCLLVAKRRPALRRLHELFRLGEVQKCYTTLLLGFWKGGNQNVDAPLLTTERRNGERHVRVSDEGKPARTRFVPETYFGQTRVGAQLTSVELDTGRTHQIRVHAAHLGHPVAGDRRYGPEDDPIVREFGLTRLFLHASTLVFESPGGDRVIRAECPLDEGLSAVLEKIGRKWPVKQS
jgi:23S rRNA pseudouridine955/2504/2580 synthase